VTTPHQPSEFDLEAKRIGLTERTDRIGTSTYRGTVHGRTFTLTANARFRTQYHGTHRRRVLSGFQITIETPCPTSGRLVLTPSHLVNRFVRWINRKGGLLPVEGVLDGTLNEAWTHEPAWAARGLSDPEIINTIGTLLPDRNTPGAHSLQWYPDRLGFNTFGHLSQSTPKLELWVEQVARLAEATDRWPKPSHPHQPGWMERRPVLLISAVVGIFLAACIIIPILLVGIAILVSR
jgi:hypothetical protein